MCIRDSLILGHLLDSLRPLGDMLCPASLSSIRIGKARLDTLHIEVTKVKEVELRVNGEVVSLDAMKARSPDDRLCDDAWLSVACR